MTTPRNPDDPRDRRNLDREHGEAAQGAHEAVGRRAANGDSRRAGLGRDVQGASPVRGSKGSGSKGWLWALLAVLAAIIIGLLIWWAVHHFTHNDDDGDSSPVSGAASSVSSAAGSDGDSSGVVSTPAIPGAPVPGVLESPTASAPPSPTVASTRIDTPTGQAVSITDPAIIAEYASRGYERGYLGKPLGPVANLPGGGKFLTLQGGSIYYNPVAKKAFSVHGAIGGYWGDKGHEKSALGFPNGEETATDGGVSQSFDNGTLTDKNGTVTESK